jgi:predicted phosphodiesterase
MSWVRLACLLLILISEALAAETIALISDLNGRYGSVSYDRRVTTAVDVIVCLEPDLVISTGDMVAGQKQPWLDSQRLQQMWHSFNDTVANPLLKVGIPFVVTAGNHDGSAFPEFALEREHFEAQWQVRMPQMDILPGSEWPRRYAARLGALLLIAFDGTRPGKLPEEERLFVDQMLSRYGTAAEATIVFSHLPMWPMARGREHEILDDADLLSLLHRNGVDLYASGHHHAFYAGIDEAGMVHVGVGALGGNARAFAGGGQRQPHSFAVLSVDRGEISVTARAAPGFDTDMPVEQLPAAISGPLGLLRRVDGPVRLRP